MSTSKRLMTLLLLSSLAVSFSGCDLLSQFMPGDKTAEAEAVSEEEGEEEEAPKHDTLFVSGPQPAIDTYRPLSVAMPDGLKLEGTLYVPGIAPYKPIVQEGDELEELLLEEEGEAEGEHKKAPKAVKPAKVQYPVVVLLHMLSGDRWDWKEYPRYLVKNGYAVLALDMRGHGDSVYRGKRLHVWRQFAQADWEKLWEDVNEALKYISTQQDFNMVNTNQVAIVGASIGANAAVNYASHHPKQVKAIVLLSPGEDYEGVKTFNPLTHYEGPVYFIASKEDSYSANSVQRLYKFALGKKKIQIFEGIGHGTDMMVNNPDLTKMTISWLKRIVPPPGGSETEEPEEHAAENTEAEHGAEKTDAHGASDDKSTKTAHDATDKAKDAKKGSAGEKDKPKTYAVDTKAKDTKDKPKAEPAAKKPEPKKPEKPAAETKPVTSKPDAAKPATKPAESPKPKPATPPASPAAPAAQPQSPSPIAKPIVQPAAPPAPKAPEAPASPTPPPPPPPLPPADELE